MWRAVAQQQQQQQQEEEEEEDEEAAENKSDSSIHQLDIPVTSQSLCQSSVYITFLCIFVCSICPKLSSLLLLSLNM